MYSKGIKGCARKKLFPFRTNCKHILVNLIFNVCLLLHFNYVKQLILYRFSTCTPITIYLMNWVFTGFYTYNIYVHVCCFSMLSQFEFALRALDKESDDAVIVGDVVMVAIVTVAEAIDFGMASVTTSGWVTWSVSMPLKAIVTVLFDKRQSLALLWWRNERGLSVHVSISAIWNPNIWPLHHLSLWRRPIDVTANLQLNISVC